MTTSFASLQTMSTATIKEAQKLSKDSMLIQLDMFANGEATPLFHSFADTLQSESCLVVMKNQSCVLFKSLRYSSFYIANQSSKQ